jgi:serine/threonine-protein kinase
MSQAKPDTEALQTLLADGKLEQAARLSLEGGDALRASALFEQGCAFSEASQAASRGGDWRGAVRLAAVAAADGLLVKALDALVAQQREAAPLEAEALSVAGAHRYAAWLFDRLGDDGAAAEAYLRAQLPLAAAHAYERAGQVAAAARTLEAAIRAARSGQINPCRVALGALYVRHGKHEAAAGHLQAVPEDSSERAGALDVLIPALGALGLHAAELKREQAALARTQTQLAPAAGDALAVDDALGSEAAAVAVKLFGRYRVLHEVAVTPHARLLHAIDELTGEEVALKWLTTRGSPRGRDALTRFVREARALAELRHPAIVELRSYVERGPAMVLEWMPGGDLSELLARESLAPARAAEIAVAVLAALGVAHRMGIIHRDLKPANLLFDGLGAVHLADFGAAHWSASQETVTAGVIGTLGYMAPEQRRGEAASVASDVYSVGVIFYEMLTGQRFVRQAKPSASHPDLTPLHDEVVAMMLCEEQAVRYATAGAAQRGIAGLSWSDRVIAPELADPVAQPVAAEGDSAGRKDRFGAPHVAATRVVESSHLRHDAVLCREVLLLPAGDTLLARAARIARASHSALPGIWGVSEDGQFLVVEPALGEPAGALSKADQMRLSEALAALHAVGGVHGAVHDEHIRRHAGQTYIAFAIEPEASATASTDRAQLADFARARAVACVTAQP